MSPLLEIRNLSVAYPAGTGWFRAVDGLDLVVEAGEFMGIVGESGSGKSVAMLAVMGLLDAPARITADRLAFDGADLLRMPPAARRRLAGKDIAMVFQDPGASLNPCFPVGWQVAEALRVHGVPRRERRGRVLALLHQVGIPAPETRLRAFPHQLSGGMNQRVMVAMAIACNPRLLIADEPTTALDVTIQRQLLDLLTGLQRERGMAMILITHDMGVVAQTARRVQVMYAGQQMEEAQAATLFRRPRHPYTAALLQALPERAEGHARLPTIAGVVPGPFGRPPGCLFQPRCTRAQADCAAVRPPLSGAPGERLRCFHPVPWQ